VHGVFGAADVRQAAAAYAALFQQQPGEHLQRAP
jgi:hypothetical protein